MFTRMIHFQANANRKPEMLTIMDRMIPKIKAQRGCKDCMFIMEDEEGSYALLVFWETSKDADVAAPIIGPEIIPALNKIAKEPVTPLLYEVYQPVSLSKETSKVF